MVHIPVFWILWVLFWDSTEDSTIIEAKFIVLCSEKAEERMLQFTAVSSIY